MISNPFDWELFWILAGVSVPGLIFGTKGFIRTYWHYIKTHYPAFKKAKVVTGFIIINIIIITASIAVGIHLSATTNARYVYFMAVIKQTNTTQAFLFEFLGALTIGFPAALVYLAFYYYGFRSMLDEKALFILERMRNHSGLGSRIFYESVISEILFRWGIQSVFIFVLIPFMDYGTLPVVLAIILTSIVYSTLHLFNLRFIKITGHISIAYRALVLHLFSSVIFGIVFWKFGILGAIIVHSLFHILWYPLDIFYYRKFPAD